MALPSELVRARRIALRWAPVPWSAAMAAPTHGPTKVRAFVELCRRFLARPANRPLARALLRDHPGALACVLLHTGDHYDDLGTLAHAARAVLRARFPAMPAPRRPPKPPETLSAFRAALCVLSAAALERAAARGSAGGFEPEALARADAVLATARSERLLEALCLRSIHHTPYGYDRVLFDLRLRPPMEAPCPSTPSTSCSTPPNDAPGTENETPPSTSPS